MWKSWRHHAWALGILVFAGLWTTWAVGPQRAAGEHRILPFLIPDYAPGTLGVRFFGYGALVLLGLALAIGPLARLRPRTFTRLIPYRRAVGIWSAIAAGVHLLFVLQLVSFEFYNRTWLTLFLRRQIYVTPDLKQDYVYSLQSDTLGLVAWTGLIALFLLLVVALVSNDWSQKRLGQATWKLIQQRSYTAFLFVLLHVLLMRYGGKLKLSPPLARWAIWFLLAVALLQVIGFGYTIYKRRTGRGDKDAVA